ncbi:MAG TPA: response regulator [Candidatus Dormibacteraeota bacterium]|nr:response regulator [Candidatus Dormibacteraeota bacterium]
MSLPSEVVEILLVEDSPADARLTQEAFKDGKVRNNLAVVSDGVQAMAYLRREGRFADAARPDLVLLDLNLPKMDGREVLKRMKTDPGLMTIPVVILTTSQADVDVLAAYEYHANCYIQKPVDLTRFLAVIAAIETFWLTVVKLPVVAE